MGTFRSFRDFSLCHYLSMQGEHLLYFCIATPLLSFEGGRVSAVEHCSQDCGLYNTVMAGGGYFLLDAFETGARIGCEIFPLCQPFRRFGSLGGRNGIFSFARTFWNCGMLGKGIFIFCLQPTISCLWSCQME